ncbi:MAG: DUF2637 domain-containing protein [Streptosporangiaceae bacterium]
MTGDRAIRRLTAAVVLAVAAFAAVVSYSHIYDLGRAHGQSGTAARLLPLSVDGLIVAAGLVLLHAARNGRPAPALARAMLWLGISATVGANISYGLPFGPLGAVVSAWPAVAFVGAAEMALGMVRSVVRAADGPPVPGPVTEPDTAGYGAGNGLPAHLAEAQRRFAGDLAAGTLPAIRRIRAELGVGQAKATEVRAHLAALTATGGNPQ